MRNDWLAEVGYNFMFARSLKKHTQKKLSLYIYGGTYTSGVDNFGCLPQ